MLLKQEEVNKRLHMFEHCSYFVFKQYLIIGSKWSIDSVFLLVCIIHFILLLLSTYVNKR